MVYDIMALAALGHLVAQFCEDNGILQFKPFNCNLCVSFWIALIPGFIEYGMWGLPFAALVGVTSEVIYKILNRL